MACRTRYEVKSRVYLEYVWRKLNLNGYLLIYLFQELSSKKLLNPCLPGTKLSYLIRDSILLGGMKHTIHFTKPTEYLTNKHMHFSLAKNVQIKKRLDCNTFLRKPGQ